MNNAFFDLMERLCSYDFLTADDRPRLPKKGILPFGWCTGKYVYVYSSDVRGSMNQREYAELLRELEENGYTKRGFSGASERVCTRYCPGFGPVPVVIFLREPVEAFFSDRALNGN